MSNYKGGVLNRRKRALERNERQYKVSRLNLDTVNARMTLMENNPKEYKVEIYKVLIAEGVRHDSTVKRLEVEMQALKNRI